MEESKKALIALKNYLNGEEKRGSLVVNSYGHTCEPYTGLISLWNDDKIINIKSERKGDIGISIPVSLSLSNGQETLFVQEILDDEKKLIYKR
jgi:hypothetical protein